MAIALVLLALGSVVAGYLGIPHALGGHNQLGEWLHPAFEAPHAAGPEVAGGAPPGHRTAPVAPVLSGMTLAAPCEPGAPDTTTAGGALAGMAIAPCEAAATDVAPAANVALPPGATLEFSPVAAGLPPSREASADRHSLGDGGQTGRPAAALSAAQPGAAAAQVPTAEDEHAKERLELMLMGVSSLIALLGIGVATWLWLKNPATADRLAATFPGLHRLLLNKYYVDEIYDVTVVQPVKNVSEKGLWRIADVRLVDGAVNGAGLVVGAFSAVFRLFQTGSVKTYAASIFLGAVLILAYYAWR